MECGGAPAITNAEIDTSAPFRSVKEAVARFGDKVLAGELYPNKLKEDSSRTFEHDPISELDEAKRSLEKAREESMQMSRYLSSLQQELDATKMELQLLKLHNYTCDLEITEELKFVDDSIENNRTDQKKYVRFANPPAVAVAEPPRYEPVLRRHSSLRIKKKKSFAHFIGGLFGNKKGSSEI